MRDEIDPLHIELARQANADDRVAQLESQVRVERHTVGLISDLAERRWLRIAALEAEVLELRTLIVLAAHQ